MKAHSIMEPVASWQGSLEGALHASPDTDLDHLIDQSLDSELPVVIVDAGAEVGIVTREALLRGVQGAK